MLENGTWIALDNPLQVPPDLGIQKNISSVVSTYTFIFCLFSSDTLQVLMFVCPTALELCFYGCCHTCLRI